MNRPFRRHGPLWIFGRVGILIVFGIMPLMRACDRIKKAPLHEAQSKCTAAYNEMFKYPVLSDAWNSNKAIGDQWESESERLFEKFYGKRK